MFTNPSRELNGSRLEGKRLVGTIVDNNDPLQVQRVKIRVNNIHNGVSDADLPWAIRLGPTGDGTSVSVPDNGKQVVVSFMDNSDEHPIYEGEYYSQGNKLSNELLADYPNSYGIVDRAGNMYAVNMAQGTIKIFHSTGTTILITPSGGINIDTMDTVNVNITGEANLTTSGNTTVESGGDTTVSSSGPVTVTGPTIDLN